MTKREAERLLKLLYGATARDIPRWVLDEWAELPEALVPTTRIFWLDGMLHQELVTVIGRHKVWKRIPTLSLAEAAPNVRILT